MTMELYKKLNQMFNHDLIGMDVDTATEQCCKMDFKIKRISRERNILNVYAEFSDYHDSNITCAKICMQFNAAQKLDFTLIDIDEWFES